MRTWRVAMALMLGTALAAALGLGGCSEAPNPWKELGGPPHVVVTIPPLYSFTRGVAGQQAGILCLCTTTGPHHYETTQQDSIALSQANLFFANGLGLDRFADKLQQQSHNPRLRFVPLGDRLPEKMRLHAGEHDEDEDHDHGHDGKKEEAGHHHEGEFDPHAWLGIAQATAMVGEIRDELVRADPDHKQHYEDGARSYIKQLDELHRYGKDRLKGKKNRKIVAFHDSLNYFAHSFGLEIVETIEQTPGVEPTPKQRADLVAACKKHGVRVIAVEPQYPQHTSAKSLQDELKKLGLDVELVVVDPLETADPEELKKEGAEWYLRRMRSNLDNLAQGLR